MHQPDQQDTHGPVRFFKQLEVAYNMARNGYHERALEQARVAVAHGDEVDLQTETYNGGDA